MALRNAIKAAILSSERETPLYGDESRLFADRRIEAPPPPPALDVEPVPDAAPPPPHADDGAARWRARAKEIRAMARTLPRKSKRRVIRQIAGLYDELAQDAARLAQDAPAPEDARRAEAVPPALMQPAEPPPAKPRPAKPATLARRALPSTRHRSIRR